MLGLKSVSSAAISPDGKYAAYTVIVPRTFDEKPGGSYSELHIIDLKTKVSGPFIIGKENISSIAWSPDGSEIAFRMRRGEKAKSQVWSIPLSGGEARQLTDCKSGVSAFAWHPSGKQIAYIATEPETKREKTLEDKGYGFIYFEEYLKHKNLYLVDVLPDSQNANATQLTSDVTVWSFVFSEDGKKIALAATEKNLIDYSYMFKHVHLLDVATKEIKQLTQNPGKLGNFKFSPDGKQLAYTAALETKDHAVSQVYVMPVKGGEAKNLTKANFRGHVHWVNWKDNNTIIYFAKEAANVTLTEVNLKNNKHKQILTSENNGGIIFSPPDYTTDFKQFVFHGDFPAHPDELFYWQPGKKMNQLTELNPQLKNTELGKQKVISYKADDGQEVEGILIYPVGYKKDVVYPTIVLVHGGPESHYSNGWVSGYSTPGQVLAGKGYAVFYPNYRASTGYGLDFALAGYGDAAGVEFDDIRDGIKHLIDIGLADKDRIGLGGGSYGGFASAWFATYYTEYVKAVCMFVGISDLISKRGTTDIPYEELLVHSGKPLEEMWDQSLKRSPIYYAHQSKTATLIYGGANDTRVHPSQSIELYRRMKMNHHPAVRLVQYPGEGHGNRNQTGRLDVILRILDWYDWYVKDANPLNGPMPPLDISDKYGIDLPADK
ncbi:MAG: S9 family peptidase [Calditrichaceae bacterium]|nr:S9 family peptidase [Calditrichaceae bacterium]